MSDNLQKYQIFSFVVCIPSRDNLGSIDASKVSGDIRVWQWWSFVTQHGEPGSSLGFPWVWDGGLPGKSCLSYHTWFNGNLGTVDKYFLCIKTVDKFVVVCTSSSGEANTIPVSNKNKILTGAIVSAWSMLVKLAGSGVLADMVITSSVYYYLRPSRTGVRRSQNHIQRIATMTINMGILTWAITCIIWISSCDLQWCIQGPVNSFVTPIMVMSQYFMAPAQVAKQVDMPKFKMKHQFGRSVINMCTWYELVAVEKLRGWNDSGEQYSLDFALFLFSVLKRRRAVVVRITLSGIFSVVEAPSTAGSLLPAPAPSAIAYRSHGPAQEVS
ncbi:hypothetical protein BU15DRAFT_65260 [Melanogaster broomeanus]|nr:hypothetical protein BU15DRAFT_65260 [Melanogaster broomeanus]